MVRAGLIAVALVTGHLLEAFEPRSLSYDRGAAGLWQRLQKLGTTASLLHTTAHPDDEHGGMLALESRGHGTRVALLSLTRGEAGDNAIGYELFDTLGWVRAEELRVAGGYYGLDALYFTRLADYGYSKRREEAVEKWGHDEALRDVVYVIRRERPLVVVSRFQGNARDGHGQHQFAGLITREAFLAAGDPDRFPEQLQAGLRPWRPLKLYIGGVREDEAWNLVVDSGSYSPWLGDSFINIARTGLSYQRSQNGGRLRREPGPFRRYYRREESRVDSGTTEVGFFDGIDTSLAGFAKVAGLSLREDEAAALAVIDGAARRALDVFEPSNLRLVQPPLGEGLAAVRRALKILEDRPDVVHLLRVKEEQFMEAMDAAVALEVHAIAQALGTGALEPSPFAPPPTLGPVVPGEAFEVQVTVASRSGATPSIHRVFLESSRGWDTHEGLSREEGKGYIFEVRLDQDAAVWKPAIVRGSIAESRYQGEDDWFRVAPLPSLFAVVEYEVEGVGVTRREPVRRWESRLPYGYVTQTLEALPGVSVRMSPDVAVVPISSGKSSVEVTVEVRNFRSSGLSGLLSLELPAGWTSEPESRRLSFSRPGAAERLAFRVEAPSLVAGEYGIGAVVRADGLEYRESYEVIAHRDLETRYQVLDADARIAVIDVEVPEDLRVGYIMGVGDAVPEAIAGLGASVELLDREALAARTLHGLDAIVVGTRAYAVRDDLRTHNARLLDYVERGGNLIVLYNTPELDPNLFAPFPGVLPRSSEEVSEEDAPVEILAPEHQSLVWPNRITAADFEDWVEQRGSKFWSEWDSAYTSVIESHDTGQSPQRGGWLTARYGEGHYTYFAYALHRQLPFGVAGAYRILANLLSLGRKP